MFEKLFRDQLGSKNLSDDAGTDRPLRGTILEGVSSISEEVFVFVETLGENARRGPCVWEPVVDQNGVVWLPGGGEECIVQFDDKSLPWVRWVPDANSHEVPPAGGWETGDIKATLRSEAPAGWLILEGQAVSRTGATAALFALWGTAYGEGDKATTFNVLDARNRTMIGISATHPVHTVGGEETVKLTENQMPEHTHEDEGHTHEPEGGGNFVKDAAAGASAKLWGSAGEKVVVVVKTALSKAKLKKAGKSEAHNNMPPFFTGNWMVKL